MNIEYRFKVPCYLDREKMVVAFANSGYAVHIEETEINEAVPFQSTRPRRARQRAKQASSDQASEICGLALDKESLVSIVDELKKENADGKEYAASVERDCENYRAENDRLAARNAELEDLFTLQHTRTVEAVALWREAHPGNDSTMPDLGKLLAWLIGERKQLKELLEDVYTSGVEDIKGIRYLTVQIYRDLWAKIQAELAEERKGKE